MFGHFLAATVALSWSFRYQRALKIRAEERKRYWLKAINLALCYRGFAPDSKLSSINGAGKAAFFCCAYDVITDWQDFDTDSFEKFESLLHESLTAEAAKLAVALYWQEKDGLLEENGLSRGIAALEFVTNMMGTESFIRQKTDFKHLGTVMQIVDDVLDVEDDEREQEMNCLSSPKRNEFLAMLVAFPTVEMEMFLPKGLVLWKVVKLAQQKAKNLLLLYQNRPASAPLVNVDCRPHRNVT